MGTCWPFGRIYFALDLLWRFSKSRIALPNTMLICRLNYLRTCAGMLILTLGLAGSAYGSSRTSTSKTHANARLRHVSAKGTRASRHQASLHHSSLRHTPHRRFSGHHHPAVLGQRIMDPQRAIEIQQALIQAHYLNGSPTGQWDSDTQAAMVKYQTDNGWQSKITPDSRALIKLGLGPKQDAGEYAPRPSGISGISKAPDAAPTDTIRTMATAETPMTSSN